MQGSHSRKSKWFTDRHNDKGMCLGGVLGALQKNQTSNDEFRHTWQAMQVSHSKNQMQCTCSFALLALKCSLECRQVLYLWSVVLACLFCVPVMRACYACLACMILSSDAHRMHVCMMPCTHDALHVCVPVMRALHLATLSKRHCWTLLPRT